MKEAETWPRRVNERDMTAPRLRRGVAQRACAVRARREPEVPAERPREHFVTVESGLEGDIQNRVVARHQPGRSLLKLEAQRVLLGRLPHHRTERAMEMERRPSCARGQLVESRTGAAPMANLSDDVQEIAGRRHRLTQS